MVKNHEIGIRASIALRGKCLKHVLRVLLDRTQQRSRRFRWLASALLPISQGAQLHTQEFGETSLTEIHLARSSLTMVASM